MKTQFPIVRLMKGIMLKYIPGMLSCNEFEQFIDDYLENSLSAAEVKVFERHLKLCDECRTYLAAYKNTIELGKAALSTNVNAVTLDEIPADLIKAINAARAQKEPQ